LNVNLNEQQKKAMNHINGPALVLAVPGAGKTTVLIHRTANLILNQNVPSERILSITFSRASARDMKERFLKLYKNFNPNQVHFSTIHSFAYGLVKEYFYRYNIKYGLIEGEKSPLNKNRLLRKIYFDINNEYLTEERFENVANTIGYIKNMLLDIDEYLKLNNVEINNFREIFVSYENFKRKNHLIDFDDMLTLSLQILKEDRYLLNKYRNKYDYIQVDEGQDTSKVQIEIIRTIAAPRNNVFVVADDDQSIYGFRGAFPRALLNFNKMYPSGKIFYMEENFRSSKNIVSVCNKFIKQNTLRYNKNLFTANKNIRPITIVKVENMLDQYDYLVQEIKEHEDYKNTAILYRNNISAIGLIEFFERNSIPFYIRDSKIHFFNHWVVDDILSFLRLAHDDKDMETLEKIYFKMKGYIYKKYINYIKTLDCNISVFDRLMEYPYLEDEYKSQIRELKYDFKKLSNLRPYEAISFIEKNLKYEKYLRENSLKFGYTFDSLKTILYFLKIISSRTNNVYEFVGRLKYLDYLTQQSKESSKGVTLSTVHSSKGLEYKNVYIIDLIDGEFPAANSVEAFEKGNIEALEEERRLFYVGMTRAKEVLDLITICNKNEKRVENSRFVKELEVISRIPLP
jgi:DNA helicase II / ATP-dependent DNA helicase PcrA